MKTTFRHKNDGLDSYFEMVNLAREALSTIDTNDEEVRALVILAKDELNHLEMKISQPAQEIDWAWLSKYEPDYTKKLKAAGDAETIAAGLSRMFAANVNLKVFRDLYEALDDNIYEEYWTLEEQRERALDCD